MNTIHYVNARSLLIEANQRLYLAGMQTLRAGELDIRDRIMGLRESIQAMLDELENNQKQAEAGQR